MKFYTRFEDKNKDTLKQVAYLEEHPSSTYGSLEINTLEELLDILKMYGEDINGLNLWELVSIDDNQPLGKVWVLSVGYFE